jgi:hypothetical protein
MFCIRLWEEPGHLKVLRCGILQSGYGCRCSTIRALPFPLQNVYVMYVGLYFTCKFVGHFAYGRAATQYGHSSFDRFDSAQVGTMSSYSVTQ